MDGFIKLHRQLFDSSQFCNPVTLKIWVWILLKANYKKKYVSLKIGKGSIDVLVERGQFVFGRHKAEDELNIDGSTIYRNLKKLEDEQAIIINSNNQYSLITVCNYDTYNQKEIEYEQPMNNLRTTNEQPTNTTKKDNKEKNINVSFDEFYNLYGKKVSKDKTMNKWPTLTDAERTLIMAHIPKYKVSEPNPKFRKDPISYLINKTWLDEIIEFKVLELNGKKVTDQSSNAELFNVL